MKGPVREAAAMIAGMAPVRQPGRWAFCTTAGPAHPAALATIREAEGLSQVLPFDVALALGQEGAMPMVLITLSVHSALDGVGLTAAVAGALAAAGIPCNMVAGFHHDHLFLPEALADQALRVLSRLARGQGGPPPG